MITTATIYLN